MRFLPFGLFCFCLVPLALGEDAPSVKWHATVSVAVDGAANQANDNTLEVISSFLKRELRALNDVTIVETNADYNIGVLCFKIPSARGQSMGYCVSYVVTEPVRSAVLAKFTQASPPASQLIDAYLVDAVHVDDHRLFTVPPDKLRTHCEEFVASLDSGQFEPSRHAWTRAWNFAHNSNSISGQTNRPPSDSGPKDGPK